MGILGRLLSPSLTSAHLTELARQGGAELRAIAAEARLIGHTDEAAVLEAFANRTAVDTPALREWGPPGLPLLRMAAHSILAQRARRSDVGVEALAEITPGRVPTREEVDAFTREKLGWDRPPADLRALFGFAAMRFDELHTTLSRGGIPLETRLAPDQLASVRAALAASDLEFARNVEVPAWIRWTPHEEFTGVGSGEPLYFDPETGSDVVPVYVASGARLPEYIHIGEGRIVWLPGSGPLLDARGTHAPTREAREGAGLVHTPYVPLGSPPSIFLSLCEYGTVETGLRGTRGAELLERRGIGQELVAALFRGIPPTMGDGARPRETLSHFLFRLLKTPVIDPVAGRAGAKFLLEDLAGRTSNQRLAYAHGLVSEGT